MFTAGPDHHAVGKVHDGAAPPSVVRKGRSVDDLEQDQQEALCLVVCSQPMPPSPFSQEEVKNRIQKKPLATANYLFVTGVCGAVSCQKQNFAVAADSAQSDLEGVLSRVFLAFGKPASGMRNILLLFQTLKKQKQLFIFFKNQTYLFCLLEPVILENVISVLTLCK